MAEQVDSGLGPARDKVTHLSSWCGYNHSQCATEDTRLREPRDTFQDATATAALFTAPQAVTEFRLRDRSGDTGGDLVADILTDPSDLIDPATLLFAYTPFEDPAVYAQV